MSKIVLHRKPFNIVNKSGEFEFSFPEEEKDQSLLKLEIFSNFLLSPKLETHSPFSEHDRYIHPWYYPKQMPQNLYPEKIQATIFNMTDINYFINLSRINLMRKVKESEGKKPLICYLTDSLGLPIISKNLPPENTTYNYLLSLTMFTY